MAICTNMSKCFVTIINLIFWAAGAVLIFLGSWLFAKYVRYGHHTLTMDFAILPAVILIVVGVLAALVGLVGCIAACKEQKCVTGLFFTLMLLILTGLIAGGVLSFLYSKQIDDDVHEFLKTALDQYDENNDTRADVDTFQAEFDCCGIENYTNWLDTAWYKNQSEPVEQRHQFPASCCNHENCTTFQPGDTELHGDGCYSKAKVAFKHHLVIIGSVAGAFALLLFIGMVCSCVLICSRRNREVPYIGVVDDGMTV